jgi:hypothetical protein
LDGEQVGRVGAPVDGGLGGVELVVDLGLALVVLERRKGALGGSDDVEAVDEGDKDVSKLVARVSWTLYLYNA